MENVDNDSLRKFATSRFSAKLSEFQQEALVLDRRDTRGLHDPRPSELPLELGPLVEWHAWLWLGNQIGYFNKIQKTAIDPSSELLARALSHDGAGAWPKMFRNFAGTLRQGSMKFPKGLPSSFRAHKQDGQLFQSALLLAEEFRDPALKALQCGLAADHSIIDYWPENAVKTALDPIEYLKDGGSEQTISGCMAGLTRLMSMLSSWQSLMYLNGFDFRETDRSDLNSIGHEVVDSVHNQIGMIVSWRLNIDEKRTEDRLAKLLAAFWDYCELVFSQQDAQHLRWSRSQSERELKSLLDWWANFTRPQSERFGETIAEQVSEGDPQIFIDWVQGLNKTPKLPRLPEDKKEK